MALSAFGQNLTTIDSLRKSLSEEPTIAQFDLLNAIGFEYRYSYPDSTIFYCSRAYELGKRIKVDKNLSKPLSFIGLAYANKGVYNKSAEYHEHAIQVAIDQQDSVQLGFGYNNLGRMYFDGGDLVRASDNLVRSRDIFEVLQEKLGLAYVYRSLANLYKSQDQFDQAVEMSTRAYELRKQLGDKRSIVSSLLELGLIYESMDNTDMALQKMRLADSIARQVNDRVTLAELDLGMAEILFDENQVDEAYAKANEVLTIITDLSNQKLFIRASLIKARYLVTKKRYTEALVIFEDIIAKSEASGNLVYQIEATHGASGCYLALGNHSKAHELNDRFEILEEKVKNTDLQQQIERLQFQLQIEKKERENVLLKSAQVKNESLLSAQRFQNRLLIGLIISVTAAMIIFWNFSRRRKLVNQQLKAQNHQLSELNDEKNSLMNIVAHDLKAPLNRILGLTQVLELEGELSPKQKEYIQMIKNSTRAGSNLIIDLLDVNAIEEKGSAPVAASHNLKEWFDERIKTFQLAADAKQLKLEAANNAPAAFVTDADFMGRIFDNLLSNAIKFSPAGKTIRVLVFAEHNVLKLVISDEGPGFSEQDKQLIFQKFKKLSARPTGGESSNGLGLAIVKTLVDRLNGNIQLESRPGQGASFTVIIPALPK
ncbi:MAG: tetratricopeptide repeat-containing sensor histidine kinase [Cyclobacteriaceae bacterium]|nr:tetratricopeptide repeat-containing sensor histidine kinase [Cyclobacteriaceae bacterium]